MRVGHILTNATKAVGMPGRGQEKGYLEHPAHPLEAVLLRGVGPLLSHDHYPLVMQNGH